MKKLAAAKYLSCLIWGSFWQKHSLLQQTMTLLQGPKDPVLPSLVCFPKTDTYIFPKSTLTIQTVHFNKKQILYNLPQFNDVKT